MAAIKDYKLNELPFGQEQVYKYATGGSTATTAVQDLNTNSTGAFTGTDQMPGKLTPGLLKALLDYKLVESPFAQNPIQKHAAGGEIEGHNPTFFSQGGLESMENKYVQGEGDGTSDSVAAMLANGEFVIPADVVAKLGNGSNEAGAGVLDQFLKSIRTHANSNGTSLPPESKGPLAYLLDAKRKVKA
jgi:hypothetical protein